MTKYLVTGGAGFIGSNTAEELARRGHQVRVLDNLSSGKRENLLHLSDKIELMVGDVRDKSACMKAARGVDYVLHLAALSGVGRSVEHPEETNAVNVDGTLNILMAANEAKVKRLVFASSCAIYGDCSRFPLRETERPNPHSPYAASKIMGEYYSQIFAKLYGLETVCLRYFNIFGPRQNPESVYAAVIPLFIDRLLNGAAPEIHWDGKQSRDFAYVDNVVLGNILAAETPGVSGEIFNIASQEEYSVLDIFNGLKKVLKLKNAECIFKPKRPGDIRRSFADTGKADKLLNFKCQTNFRRGLEKTVKWFLESRAPRVA